MSRAKFIEISEGIFRELGFTPPSMFHEESLPLVMELELEGRSFELIHSPGGLAEKILIVCKLGKIPDMERLRGIQGLMKENLLKVRIYGEWFGINSSTNEIHLMCHQDLGEIKSSEILQHMRVMVENSNDWQNRFFDFSDGEPSIAREVQNNLLA